MYDPDEGKDVLFGVSRKRGYYSELCCVELTLAFIHTRARLM